MDYIMLNIKQNDILGNMFGKETPYLVFLGKIVHIPVIPVNTWT